MSSPFARMATRTSSLAWFYNPGEKHLVRVEMQHAATGAMPAVTSTVKISVNPSRAAVFLDGQFAGHVDESNGAGQGMLVVPGSHTIKIALPEYQTFETQINPLPRPEPIPPPQ